MFRMFSKSTNPCLPKPTNATFSVSDGAAALEARSTLGAPSTSPALAEFTRNRRRLRIVGNESMATA